MTQHTVSNFIWPSHDDYQHADPFPHTVLNDMWDPDLLDRVRQEVEAQTVWEGEKSFYGSVAKRWQSDWQHLTPTVASIFHFLATPYFLRELEKLTGEKGLIPDPYLKGGGIHSTGKDGFLKLHADFNWHKEMSLYRRLNILIYLNKSWNEEFGGDLKLARKEPDGTLTTVQSILPHFNRTVIFTTDDNSFHGQPEPLKTPENVRRNSLAAYYYVAAKPDGTSEELRTNTDYRTESGKAAGKKSILQRMKARSGF